ncbi:LysR family transcriptional regulator ArgP [Arthrobacter koreensis]|uniref:LysR family transcriptional regulator ArgP n=1 Tax=Arthrobacter koreensis TaxID=199136 RepID=UPI002DBA8545|nr:LysR family transcriptional regulator ArgP [Arthrobacter koreensis]MEB7503026.1 LysR family transcriptional regulator ArgP [Arthrobacter koreensis]
MEFNADQLRALAAVLDHGSFDAAAAALHLTTSAVSQRVKALETRTGCVLLRRARPIAPTEPGAVLLRLARQITALEHDAVERLGLDSQPGRTPVQLVINADSLSTWVLPALAELEGTNFEFTVEDQDYSAESLRNGTAMGAVTSSPEPVQGCSVTPLGTMRYRPTSSPAFRRRWFAAGFDARGAASAPMVVFNRRDALQSRFLESALAPGLEPPRHYVPASWDFLQAVRLGFGWGMLPDLQSEALLEEGSVVLLDPDAHLDVQLYWQQWRVELPALAGVAGALTAAAGRGLLY